VRLTLSYLDETQRGGIKPPGEAAIISVTRTFRGHWALAGRWSKSYRRFTADYRELFSLGILRLAPFGFDDDFVGLGLFAGDPSDPEKGHEYGAEIIYKLQLTQSISIMPDIQYWYRNDSNLSRVRSWVFGIRLNFEF
jgi:carbohydrate-selective porin OprB